MNIFARFIFISLSKLVRSNASRIFLERTHDHDVACRRYLPLELSRYRELAFCHSHSTPSRCSHSFTIRLLPRSILHLHIDFELGVHTVHETRATSTVFEYGSALDHHSRSRNLPVETPVGWINYSLYFKAPVFAGRSSQNRTTQAPYASSRQISLWMSSCGKVRVVPSYFVEKRAPAHLVTFLNIHIFILLPALLCSVSMPLENENIEVAFKPR